MKTAAALLKTVPAALFYKNIKKFFLLKNAAALRTLFFETCNCARVRAICYVIKNGFCKAKAARKTFQPYETENSNPSLAYNRNSLAFKSEIIFLDNSIFTLCPALF